MKKEKTLNAIHSNKKKSVTFKNKNRENQILINKTNNFSQGFYFFLLGGWGFIID